MWYFAWVLGVGFAGTFSILNAMWLELHESEHAVVRSDDRAK
jgi:cyd operon protein YbgT